MTTRQRRRHRRRGGWKSKILLATLVVILTIVSAGLAAGGWVLSTADKAPPLSSCRAPEKGGNSVVFAGDGSRLGRIGSDEAFQPVNIHKIPKSLQRATIAIEDQRFYDHDGVDYEGVFRAAFTNIKAGETKQGGSTITMQLMRNLCLTNPKRNIERKIIEARLATEYEKKHDKAQILGQYLNTASYGTVGGTTSIGVQAASKFYFSKPVDKLDLQQAAMLAGLPQAPSEYNPLLNPSEARSRRNEVLGKMAELGYITNSQAQSAKQADLGLHPFERYFDRREPYFFDYVQSKLIEKYGTARVREGGLKIYTTIDPDKQKVARQAIADNLYYSTDPSSALVAVDPSNGYIRMMASSGDYSSDQFNLAAQGHRQPGSTFKMFVLTTAIKEGIDPYSTYYTSMPLNLDLPEFGHWEVSTADEGYQGTINLQQATVASDNTVFAQLDLDLGPDKVTETAKSMGITTQLDSIPAEGLGGLRLGVTPLELADAYATLASGGIHHNPIAIRKVVFPGGKVDHPEHADPKRVLPENVAYEVTRILHDNITGGTGTAAYTGCYGQAGKTGTTDNYVDAWFAGFQPNLATAVWVGYPESNDVSMSSVHGITVFGGTFPAMIWNNFYTNAHVPCVDFQVPETPIEWSPYFGSFTASAPSTYDYTDVPTDGTKDKNKGKDNGGNFDPDLYAPGVGQDPAPPPDLTPTPTPTPTPDPTPTPTPTPTPNPTPAPPPPASGGGVAPPG